MQFCLFQIGDKVVYPNQGVGIVEQISTRNLTGQPEMFYLLEAWLHQYAGDGALEQCRQRGFAAGDQEQRDQQYSRLPAEGQCKSAGDWKGRFKENSEKMRSGSLMQVAEVLKTLIILNQAKPLSFREKKMLDRSWQLLVDEIAVARGQAKEAVEALLVKSLSKVNLKAPFPARSRTGIRDTGVGAGDCRNTPWTSRITVCCKSRFLFPGPSAPSQPQFRSAVLALETQFREPAAWPDAPFLSLSRIPCPVDVFHKILSLRPTKPLYVVFSPLDKPISPELDSPAAVVVPDSARRGA